MTGVPALSKAEGIPVSRTWSTNARLWRNQMTLGVTQSVRRTAVSAAPMERAERYSVSRRNDNSGNGARSLPSQKII